MTRAALVILLLAAPAFAEEPTDVSDPRQAMMDGATLELGLAAGRGHQRASISTFGGWDGARETALFEAVAEVRLWGPITIRGGGLYTERAETLRPSIGLVVQTTDRRRHGVDTALAVAYRPEGLTEPEGEIEITAAIGGRLGSLSVLANATVGQDPEGNERDAELRTAALASVGPILVGGDARGRLALARPDGSTEPAADFLAGPVVIVPLGAYALTSQAGVSLVRNDGKTRAGALGLLGVSRLF